MLNPSTPRRAVRVLICALALIICGLYPTARGRAAVPALAVRVVALARALIGAPYAYIGDAPDTGFSCIGFVHYLYGRVGVNVPYDLGLAYTAAPHVAAADLQPGDLVFFSNTVWNGLSHVAIYAGNGWIIGADNYVTGVEMTRLSDPYWVAHYTGATRPLAVVAATAVPVSRPPRPVATIGPRPVPTVSPHPVPAARRGLVPRVGEILSGGSAGDVYSGPGYTYLRIDRLAPRTRLRVVQMQGGWTDVAYAGPGSDAYGWVDALYIARCTAVVASGPPRAPARAPTRAAATVRRAVVAVAVLLLRRGPSTSQAILWRMPYGERVAVLAQQGLWDHVQDGGTTGWAFARWLTPVTT